MRPPPGIDMPNGAVNYNDGILFCAQGTAQSGTGGLWFMPRESSAPKPIVTNFHGRDFNSVNDVVVAKDESIWFTDPCYGHEQDFRQKPKLPNQVYRYNPENGDLRVMADGFGRPNGIAFSPDESVVYITDTDLIHGDGTKDLRRPASIYAFDIISSSGAPFLTNRRLFAFAAEGFPDGIKCDVYGNVYSGCTDGVEVWNPAGTLIGRILIPGGVANFCFGKEGEMFLCNEQRLWRLQLAQSTKGALLGI
jgi:gluconolactonase